jgi:hypothetical protein
MNKHNPTRGVVPGFNGCIKFTTTMSAKFLKLAGCGLLLLFLVAVSAQAAEDVRITSSPVAVTVPLNNNTSTVITNAIHIGGGSNAVNFSVSGLPTGASYSFDVSSLTQSSTNYLTLKTVGVLAGRYTLSIDATGGATGNAFITLYVGNMWTGSPQASGNWSSSSSWVSGTVPGPTSEVLFTDLGGQTNQFTNSILDGSMTIASLRFSNATNDHYISIPVGDTLSILGSNGYSFLLDDVNLSGSPEVHFVGGGNLVVSNQNANFALLIDNQQRDLTDISGLDNFTAYVNRMGLGDYSLYPNYYNFRTNQYTGTDPSEFVPDIYLAQTNIIKALYVDPNNYTNSDDREYGLCFDNSYSQGSTTHRYFYLGITNVFYADGVCINHANEGGYLQFNPAFARFTNVVSGVTNYITNSMVAVFRGINGGRMSMFALADDGTPGYMHSNVKGYADFTGGTVDILADKFYMCRDSKLIDTNETPNVQDQFYMSKGIVDVNSAYLGYQEFTNRYQFVPDQDYRGYCEATLVVSNTATFIVHGTLTMGYTADTDPNSEPYNNFGRITVGPGGSLSANTIVVDGGADLSSGNTITINSNATLIVSNTVASSSKKLDTLSMNDGSMTLFIDGNHTGPYAYATNFNTTGVGRINIGSITNLATPVQVPLVQYDSGTPTVLMGSLPPGYSGTIINNGPGNTIDVFLTTNAPSQLAWRGYVNNSWDTNTPNWLDLNTGLHTNFATLDHVYFDDTAGVPTNIVLADSALTPGAVFMTNNTHNYFITGSGSIVGASIMTKAGAGALDIEGNTTLSLDVVQGLLTGSGTIYAANVGSGAAMLYSGTISANVTCAGQGTSSGTILGSVEVQSGGTFTNLYNINGPLTLDNGAFMKNSGTVSFPSGYTTTVNSNAFLWNLGTINGDTMQVSGTLEDSSGNLGFTITQLSINSGGTFIPGGDGIGTSYVFSSGLATYAGRLTLNSGSTTVIKVNPGSGTSTQVRSTYLDYGPSQSGQDQNGGTLLISNVGGAFAAGQVFNVFGNSFFNADAPGITGTSTNSYPAMSPSSPGPGLSWDLSHLWPNGLIGVINTPVETLTNSFAIVDSTNLVNTLTWSTNAFPQWVLETQQNPLSVGLSTNWTRIAGSWTNTSDDLTAGFKTRYITNSISSTNPAVFYRLVFP